MDNPNLPKSNIVRLKTEERIRKLPCDQKVLDRFIFEKISSRRDGRSMKSLERRTEKNNISNFLIYAQKSHNWKFWKSTQLPIKLTLILLLILCTMTFVISPDNYLVAGYWLPITILIVILAIGAIGQWFENLEKALGFWQLQRAPNKIFAFEWIFIHGTDS